MFNIAVMLAECTDDALTMRLTLLRLRSVARRAHAESGRPRTRVLVAPLGEVSSAVEPSETLARILAHSTHIAAQFHFCNSRGWSFWSFK